MRKSVALMLVLIFLTSSCLVVGKPALSSSAELVENSWVSKEPLPFCILGVAAVNGRIYTFAANKTSEYDPITDTWATKMSQPSSLYGSALAVYQNKIYAIGQGNGRTQVYDPATETWQNKTSMPTPRTQLEANVVNDKIYLIGGTRGGAAPTNINEVYDPTTDSWTTKAAMPTGVFAYASAVVDNKIYFIGGSGPKPPNLNQVYDPAADTWSLGNPIPTPVVDAAASATSGEWAPKRIYVIGGRVNYDTFGTYLNQVYNPENNSWMVGASIPTARYNLHVAAVNDKLYVMGGVPYFNVQGTVCPENEEYTPFGYGAVPPAVAVVSPLNLKYNATDVSLVFAVNKPAVWMGFSLDGQENVTIAGNTTLTGLANGLHNVTVYAKDEFENTGASETVSFRVEEPFPAMIVAVASVATIAVVGVGLLLYFKKRKR